MPVDRQRKPDSQTSSERRANLLRYAGMGVELAGAIIGLTLLGLWIDHRFGTGPVGIVVGAGLGTVGGFYNFVREAWRLSRRQTVTKRDDSRHDDRCGRDTRAAPDARATNDGNDEPA